jgi:hypothetical protein
MRSINSWRLTRTRVAVYAAAVALAGSVLAAAGPAQAAQPGLAAEEKPYCEIILPAQIMRCFATPEEADEFIGNAQVGPPKGQLPGSAAGHAERSTAQVLTLLSEEFDGTFFLPPRARFWGTSGPCTTTTADIDYQQSPMPAGWDNRISSFISHSNCWVRHYAGAGFTGAFVGYSGTQAVLGISNQTSSIRWS